MVKRKFLRFEKSGKKCKKCGRQQLTDHHSWDYDYCPPCYNWIPIKDIDEITQKNLRTDNTELARMNSNMKIKTLNPVDFYWRDVTERYIRENPDKC